MGQLSTRLGAIGLLLSLLVLPFTGPAMAEETPVDTVDQDAREQIISNTDGELVAGYRDVTDCWQLSQCQEDRGIRLVDLDVGDQMDAFAEQVAANGFGEDDYEVQLEVWDSAASRHATGWGVCMYDEAGAYLGCHASSWLTGGDYVMETVDKDTETIRIMLLNNAYADYNMKIAAV